MTINEWKVGILLIVEDFSIIPRLVLLVLILPTLPRMILRPSILWRTLEKEFTSNIADRLVFTYLRTHILIDDVPLKSLEILIRIESQVFHELILFLLRKRGTISPERMC